MLEQLRVKPGYNEGEVTNFMKCLHEYDSEKGCSNLFDFTLTTFWGEAAEKSGFASPCRYVLLRDGNPIGFFQGLVRRIALFRTLRAGSTSGNGVFVFPGFSEKVMRYFLSAIFRRKSFSDSWVFSPVALDIDDFREESNYTIYIDLIPDLDEIFRKMNKKTRNRVRKAEKLGVFVDFDDSIGALRKAYDVINLASTERSFSIPPWDYTMKLHECFKRRGSASVVALSYGKGERVLSVAHLIGFDRKLVLWQAGSTQEGYTLNAGSLVQADIIKWSKNHGYLIYDMGGTNPVNPIYVGIHRFKSGFGGRLIVNRVLKRSASYVPLLRRFRSVSRGVFGEATVRRITQ